MSIWESILRVFISFIGLLVWSRIIGKKLISHLTFFDFIAGVTFGAIGGNIIFNKMVPWWIGLVNISLFSLLVLLSDFISMKSFRGRTILESKPELIINEGRLDMKMLKKTRLTIHDVLMLLRKKDIFYLDEIESAYFETDGTVSILKKSGALPVNKTDLNIQTSTRGIPETCIIDGKMILANLQSIGKTEDWMNRYLHEKNIRLEDVHLAQIDLLDRVYLFHSTQ
jgi:uncharacterized membrane protein YcaP (DUF421 family)